MKNDRDWVLWREYQSAWKRAELLQSLWEDEGLRFGVIYDAHQNRWLVNCVDITKPITKWFRGGHRRYFFEVWRDE